MQIDLRNMTVHDLIAESAKLRALSAEYDRHGVDVPEDTSEKIGCIERKIKRELRAGKLAELKQARARLEALKTDDEKRRDLASKIAELEAAIS